ncbi:queuosine precursor transporter [Candidatus Saccharibacteria bacterium]|nr:queuosine precursor transporter [Candidatus Saccharibacteria bacterium]MBQ3430686.1 queuosine precursor transporter [Candidatus Saccharibacteria bacterium]
MFGVLASISGVVLIISNLAAGKIWLLFGLPADGGLIIFPVTYIIGDLIVALYGEKKANLVVTTSTALAFVMTVIMWIVVYLLPAYPGWDGQSSFASVFGSVNRITLASLTAYFVSNVLNNHVFIKIRHGFIGKALGSSAASRLVDNLIFETLGFFGVLAVSDFIKQMIFAYVAGMILETALAPVSKFCYEKLRTSKLYWMEFIEDPVSPI